MATSFEDIHCLATILRKDTTLASLPSYQYYELCFKQLIIGKAAFVYDCHKDLNSYTPYSVSEYDFIGNGMDNEFELSPAPLPTQTNIYIGVRNSEEDLLQEVLDYTYDDTTNILTLTDIPLSQSEVVVAFFDIGSFNEDLDDDEKAILAECEQIAYYEAYLANSKSLNQVTYSTTVKIHSQAEQLKQLSNISITQWRDRVESMIVKYSYRTSKDRLKSLSGRYPYGYHTS